MHMTAVSERQPRMTEDESNGQFQSRAFNRSDAQSMMGDASCGHINAVSAAPSTIRDLTVAPQSERDNNEAHRAPIVDVDQQEASDMTKNIYWIGQEQEEASQLARTEDMPQEVTEQVVENEQILLDEPHDDQEIDQERDMAEVQESAALIEEEVVNEER